MPQPQPAFSFATGVASSWDPETREFSAIIVSGPDVVATSMRGDEVIVEAQGLDDSRVLGGTVPLLVEHDRSFQIGKVLEYKASAGRGVVRIRLDPPDLYAGADQHSYPGSKCRSELHKLQRRLEAGTQTGFSVRIVDAEFAPTCMDGGPLRIARATIEEVSVVTIPGDGGATALSRPVILDELDPSETMTKETHQPQVREDKAATTEPTEVALSSGGQRDATQPTDVALSSGGQRNATQPTDVALSSEQMDELADRIAARQARRQQRITSEVDTVTQEYELSAEQRNELVASGLTGQKLCFAANKMSRANRAASLDAPVNARTSGVGRETDRFVETREAAFSVLEARVAGNTVDREAAKTFHPWDIPSLMDIAQGLALSAGAPNGLGRGGASELAFSALVRDDLPDIMRELVNKRLQARGPGRPPVYSRLSVSRPVRDFSQILTAGTSRLKLETRQENAEIRNTQVSEEGSTYRAKLADTKLSMSYQVVIGDDIGWVQDLLAQAPVAVTSSLEEMFHECFTASDVKFDGKDLFSASRGNLQTGTLTKNNLNAAVSKLQTIKDLTGHPSNLTARYLLVPSEQEGMALDILNKRQGDRNVVVDASDTSAFSGSIDVIPSAWLSNSSVSGNSSVACYLWADPLQMRTVEHAVLEREPGPYFSTRMEIDRSLTFYLANTGAFAVANPRGVIKMTGV